MRRLLLLSMLASLALTGSAQAATPVPPAPKPAPKAVMKIKLERLISHGLTLHGRPFRVHGIITPYVSGQQVRVTVFRGKRKVHSVLRNIAPVPGHKYGRFFAHVVSRTSGRLTIRAAHASTPRLAAVVAPRVRVTVLPTTASFGSRGPLVGLLQHGLSKLGYAVPRSSVYDAGTGRAVLAYRKVNRLSRTESVTSQIVRDVLSGRGRFHARYPGHGRHVEADLSLQVIAEMNGGKVYHVYPISSGKPSTPTVIGSFHVYSKTAGTNSEGMFDANYFIRGYAIHGYPEVPTYAASHGCLRVSNSDAPAIFAWIRYGTTVDVYP